MPSYKTPVLFIVCCAAAACGAKQGPAVPGTGPSETSLTSSQAADKTVVKRLATARCDQEQKCQNIGPRQKYMSREVCMDQMRSSLGNDLNAYDCPRGLDQNAVNECAAAIQNEDCEHPFDTLSRFVSCQSMQICMK